MLTEEGWNILRKMTYERDNHQCHICGIKNVVLDCHELWEYDEHHIQTLSDVVALCKNCHRVKHIGLAELKSTPEEFARLIQHFCTVNHCDVERFYDEKFEAMMLFHTRSSYEWIVNAGKFEALISPWRKPSNLV